MPTPRLIHPVPVKLQKANHVMTAGYDHVFKEPRGDVRRKQRPVELLAQIGTKQDGTAQATFGGVQFAHDGYLLFLTEDLKAKRYRMEIGDTVIQKGSETTNLYIIKLRYMGHYHDHAGPTLLRAYYEDRHSASVRNEGQRRRRDGLL